MDTLFKMALKKPTCPEKKINVIAIQEEYTTLGSCIIATKFGVVKIK